MNKMPERLKLANLPTKIEKLERFSDKLGGPAIYIKRDDQTGTEFSGNKIRKLEFSVKEALDQGCNLLITCGGIQSNHCRCTAAVAARTGMKSCLVLRGDQATRPDGNLFIDKLLGAELYFVTPEQYKNEISGIMEQIKKLQEAKGYKPYIIPEGASNGIGMFGYYTAMEEIVAQQKEMGMDFDIVAIAVGSGGTYAGLALAAKVLNCRARVCGINVCDTAAFFKDKVEKVIKQGLPYTDMTVEVSQDDFLIIDGYVGKGYALSTPEELAFIHEFAELEGIILDPVYTGKAMYGLAGEIKKGRFNGVKNILFIHTGGLFGLFPQKESFEFKSVFL